MADESFVMSSDGGIIQVPPYEKILEEMRHRFEIYESTVRRLTARIKDLEDETYADRKMAEMRAEVEASRRAMSRGFAITDEENEAIRQWKREHSLEAHGIDIDKDYRYGGAIGGNWTYTFIPTSIGVIGEIRCSCGEKFTFCELS